MKFTSLCSGIDSAMAVMQSARSSAATGDALGAEEALRDACNRLSKLLWESKGHGARQHLDKVRDSVTLWRGGSPK
ncbi:MAG: hypothetical protein BGN89_11630 [Alphaproteobacteria bacterium 64-6]|nr:MAG: hypothetical protein BGN89_11630 [Alphaproteobacteria bacterium 64-6]